MRAHLVATQPSTSAGNKSEVKFLKSVPFVDGRFVPLAASLGTQATLSTTSGEILRRMRPPNYNRVSLTCSGTFFRVTVFARGTIERSPTPRAKKELGLHENERATTPANTAVRAHRR